MANPKGGNKLLGARLLHATPPICQFVDPKDLSWVVAIGPALWVHTRASSRPRQKMLTLLTANKDIDISEAAVLAKLVLS